MAAALAAIAQEARDSPEVVKTGPHRASVAPIDASVPDDPECWAFTWRALQRKRARWTAPDRVKKQRDHAGY